jgi:DNA polymerase-3 subunit delta'
MWNSIIGQENIKKIFNNIIKSGKFANAYIFYGNDGVGKDAVAVELAKILNCSEIYDKFEACDNCRYCRQIKSLHSPLIKYITALPTGKKNSENEDPVINLDSEDYEIYIQELHKKSNDLYYKISIPDANSIRIDSIRNLINE